LNTNICYHSFEELGCFCFSSYSHYYFVKLALETPLHFLRVSHESKLILSAIILLSSIVYSISESNSIALSKHRIASAGLPIDMKSSPLFCQAHAFFGFNSIILPKQSNASESFPNCSKANPLHRKAFAFCGSAARILSK
jgi:hypothetical protein